MKDLKDYFLYEDEDKFVKIDYDVTTNTEETDEVTLAPPVYSDTEEQTKPNSDSAADVALVGEIRLYSETSKIFYDRKRKIAEVFKSKLNSDEVNANRIKYTKIFEYFVNHLIIEYKKEYDKDLKVNLSTKNELIRQLGDDFVLLIRGKELIPEN